MAEKETNQQKKRELAERLWLSYYNRVLYEKGIVTEQEHHRMAMKIEGWRGTAYS